MKRTNFRLGAVRVQSAEADLEMPMLGGLETADKVLALGQVD